MADERARRLERELAAGDPAAARALEHERARRGVPVCDLEHSPRTARVCEHVLRPPGTEAVEHVVRFTGRGVERHVLCTACAAGAPSLADACARCFDAAQAAGLRVAFEGEPQVLERPSDLTLERTLAPLAGLVDVAPLGGGQEWLGLTGEGALVRLDLAAGWHEPVSRLDVAGLGVRGGLRLHASADGALVAVVEARGRAGRVFDAGSGAVCFELDRQDYHPEQTEFPLAFVEHPPGTTLLVHGTSWNRLDVSNPRTGALATARGPTSHAAGAPRPPHYLDYFHGRLLVAPGGEWIADDGWVWQPAGVVRTWSLRRWLSDDVWEGERGPSARDLCARDGFWGGPACWLDERTLAVYGFGDDDVELLPAALLFDVPTGTLVRWFAGPRGVFLPVGDWLVTEDADGGTAVWDPATGERLLADAEPPPTHVHPRTGELLRLEASGLTRLVLRGA